MKNWTPAYIALGSNLDHPDEQVRQAIDHIKRIRDTRVILQSSLYRSAPLGPQDQPDFVNAVVSVITQLDATTLLAELQTIERRMGRVPPAQRWGARIIDLDILMYGEHRSSDASLQLPHPEMHKRNFVMVPLAEIAPALVIPGYGLVATLAMQLKADGLKRIG